jgi:glycosyltransferase involved in cell wall biosynthesis
LLISRGNGLNILITLTANKRRPINNSLKKVLLSVFAANKDNKLKVFGIVEKTEIDENYRMIQNLGVEILALDQDSLFSEVLKLRKIVVDRRIDVIHLAGFKQLAFYYLCVMGLRKEIPLVMTERDTDRWERKIDRFLSKAFLYFTRPNLHILNSRHFSYLQKHKHLYQDIVMISNAIESYDTAMMTGVALDQQYSHVCYIKSIRKDTGHYDIIRLGILIKQNNSKILIHVIGEGALYERFLSQIIEYKLEGIIVTYGLVENKKALSILSNMDLGITVSPTEMLPNFILECFAVGIPVIGYKTQGIEDIIVNNSNGYLIEKGDTEAFFNKMSGLVNDKSKLENFSRNAKSNVRNYSYVNIGSQIIDFYNKVKASHDKF